ncbi:Aldehyde/histidinol dehydrogenase [Penicillium chrysogenum]|uniref:Aldehyde/histidinol dehydrogenase n=1 Tax=Penicillium chrysogenum TaxID=5076 RepID=UPI00239C6DDB|nr:Aldehyde/histidinol dehydrogenase [Penicillium chrysogenum]KAJ5249733.1 Aldehyde/histidinol dehydrogenase [Penicillium chrysogenum]KAJ5265324.1 Aldehyde/histidinol dehydrogenase [Penicillium chrysogenum]
MPSAEAFIELNKCSLFVQNSAFIGGEWVKATIPRDHVLGTRYRGHDAQGASRIAPTLVAGCAVVVKPPSETPCMALSLTKLAIEAGFPRKVIQLVARKDQGVASELEVNPEGTAPKGLGNGFFTRPTVLTGATVDMAVAKDATFGPLVPIFASESEEEVARLANNTEFGLAGYLYSKDIGLMMRTAQKMQVGIYGVDTGKVAAAESPFGGTKESDYRLTIGLKGASTALLSTKPSRLLPLGT